MASTAPKPKRAGYVEGRSPRESFGLIVHPVTLGIAQLAGQIEGEQAAQGNVLAFEDLVIGATALHLGFRGRNAERRHFERLPGLTVIKL